MAQNVTVSGTVTDDTGQPLPGVNVVVEGTATGTITDIEGNYSLTVPSDGVLVFNFIGFSPQSVSVDGRTSIIVIMQPSDISLDEIIVVGYGTMRKSDLTGSVASVRTEALQLWMEGARWIDMKRWNEFEKAKDAGKNIPSLKDAFISDEEAARRGYVTYSQPNAGKTVGFQAGKHEWFPYPYNVISINPNLKQNPGWEENAE